MRHKREKAALWRMKNGDELAYDVSRYQRGPRIMPPRLPCMPQPRPKAALRS